MSWSPEAEPESGRLSPELVAAERFRLAAEVSRVGIWEVDPVTEHTTWDRRTREILGAPVDGPVDQPTFYSLLHPDDRERVRAEVEHAFQPPVGVYDTEYRVGREPSPRWVRARGRAPFARDGRPPRFIGIVVDITDDQLRERGLVRLTQEAQRANEAKDRFLAMLGHELRSPLSPILRAVELLRMKGDDSRTVATIERQARQMKRLVDDLLDVASIAHGKIALQYDSSSTRAVVERAVEAVAPGFDDKQVELRVEQPEGDVSFEGDADRLVQVLANLLHNALKFSPPQSVVHLDCESTTDRVRWMVRDAGEGITPELGQRLFEPFEQGPRGRKEGGLGLGLTIVKSVVELHGGHVTASSDGPGTGAVFLVDFPRKRELEGADGDAL